MNLSYYIFLAIFAYVGYCVATNESDAQAVNLFFTSIYIQIRKYYYMVTMHPFWFTNPIGQWWMMRKYRKIAKDILSEAKLKERETTEV